MWIPAKRFEMKLGRQVVVCHCQIVLAWDPSAPCLSPTSLITVFCGPSLHLLDFFCWFLPFIEPLKQNILVKQHKIKIFSQTVTDDCLLLKQIPASVPWYQACPKCFVHTAQCNTIQTHLATRGRVYNFNLPRFCSLLKHETFSFADSSYYSIGLWRIN